VKGSKREPICRILKMRRGKGSRLFLTAGNVNGGYVGGFPRCTLGQGEGEGGKKRGGRKGGKTLAYFELKEGGKGRGKMWILSRLFEAVP